MSSQHLFILFSDMGLGGVQRKIVDIAEYVSTSPKYENFSVHILLRHRSSSEFLHYLRDKSLRGKKIFLHYQIELPFFRRFAIIPHNLNFLYLYLRYRPTGVLVFFHYNMFQVLLTKCLFWRQLHIVMSHDNILSFFNKPPHVTKKVSRSMIHFLLAFSSIIITQTQFAADDLATDAHIQRKKIVVIPNWMLDTKLRKEKRVSELIYAGRFSRQKRIDRMLNILVKVKKVFPNVSLGLIGQGGEEQKIRDMVAALHLTKNVTIQPLLYTVQNELSKAKIFLLTSEFEGHPMVLLEAMAMKTVPVILNYPGLNEYLKNGEDGFVEKNETSAAQRIIDLLKNNRAREKVAERSRKNAVKNYGKELIEKTLKIVISQ